MSDIGLPYTPAEVEFDYQYTFRDLRFGSRTSFITTSVTHMSLPSVVSSDSPREGMHGGRPGVATYGTKVIDISMTVVGTGGEDIEQKMAEVRRAFQLPRRRSYLPTMQMDALVYRRPGESSKVIMARCVKRDIPSTYEVAHGRCDVSIQLMAYDPLVYSENLYTTTLTLPPNVASGDLDIDNLGDFEDGYAPYIKLTGKWHSPVITNIADDNRNLSLIMQVDPSVGDTGFEFDMKNLWMKKNGVKIDWYTGLQGAAIANWFVILPGNNRIRVERDVSAGRGDQAGTVEVHHRHVWV